MENLGTEQDVLEKKGLPSLNKLRSYFKKNNSFPKELEDKLEQLSSDEISNLIKSLMSLGELNESRKIMLIGKLTIAKEKKEKEEVSKVIAGNIKKQEEEHQKFQQEMEKQKQKQQEQAGALKEFLYENGGGEGGGTGKGLDGHTDELSEINKKNLEELNENPINLKEYLKNNLPDIIVGFYRGILGNEDLAKQEIEKIKKGSLSEKSIEYFFHYLDKIINGVNYKIDKGSLNPNLSVIQDTNLIEHISQITQVIKTKHSNAAQYKIIQDFEDFLHELNNDEQIRPILTKDVLGLAKYLQDNLEFVNYGLYKGFLNVDPPDIDYDSLKSLNLDGEKAYSIVYDFLSEDLEQFINKINRSRGINANLSIIDRMNPIYHLKKIQGFFKKIDGNYSNKLENTIKVLEEKIILLNGHFNRAKTLKF